MASPILPLLIFGGIALYISSQSSSGAASAPVSPKSDDAPKNGDTPSHSESDQTPVVSQRSNDLNFSRDVNAITPSDDPSRDFILIEFGAEWCEPCQGMLEMIGEALSASSITQYANKVTVLTIDVDESPDLTETYNVQTVPAIFVAQRDAVGNLAILGTINGKPSTAEELSALLINWMQANPPPNDVNPPGPNGVTPSILQ